jgi:predicted nucleic acid-binding protein
MGKRTAGVARRTSVRELDASLAAELGRGEWEAISLALERHADVLLIDERAGRREAETRHLLVAGTLIVLLEAGLRGHLDFSTEIKRLRQLDFHVAWSLEAEMLAQYARQKQAR